MMAVVGTKAFWPCRERRITPCPTRRLRVQLAGGSFGRVLQDAGIADFGFHDLGQGFASHYMIERRAIGHVSICLTHELFTPKSKRLCLIGAFIRINP